MSHSSRLEHRAPVARPRLGLTVSRKVGNAVVRNRVKRSIREWFRIVKGDLQARDLVVIARPGAARLAGVEIFAELQELAAEARR